MHIFVVSEGEKEQFSLQRKLKNKSKYFWDEGG